MSSHPTPSEELHTRARTVLIGRLKTEDVLLTGWSATTTPEGDLLYRFTGIRAGDFNGRQYAVVLGHDGALQSGAEFADSEHALLAEAHEALVPPPAELVIGEAAREGGEPVTVTPASIAVTLRQGETATRTVRVRVPAQPRASRADVYFLADTTGSMSSYLAAVKSGAATILASLAEAVPDIAFGVGDYKDFPSDAYAFRHQLSPTTDGAAVTVALNGWSASGGGDWPEGQLFALDQLAVAPGAGSIQWRPGAERIVVWFGDAPGHEPVCAAISGLAQGITLDSVIAKLQAERISIVAISTATPGMEAAPSSGDYTAACGDTPGAGGQASRLAAETGGAFETGINPSTIVPKIVDLVRNAVSRIHNLSLEPAGGAGELVSAVEPAEGYGPLDGSEAHDLDFTVHLTGADPCGDEERTISGVLRVVADGATAAEVATTVTVPACPRERRWVYSVKVVVGTQGEGPHCYPGLRPGSYATEVTVHHFGGGEARVRRRVATLAAGGGSVSLAEWGQARLAPGSVTLYDGGVLADALHGGEAPDPLPSTTGLLELTSDAELAVTAVYTCTNPWGREPSLQVHRVEPFVFETAPRPVEVIEIVEVSPPPPVAPAG